MAKPRIQNSLLRLEELISSRDYYGHDPYDIKGSSLYMWALSLPRRPLLKNILRKIVVAVLIIGESFFPTLFRKLFMIKPTRNPKGIALIAKAYLNLYRLSKDEKWKKKAIGLLDWLEANKSPGYKHPCWGYPFDWASEVVIKANTPAAVVCAAVFDAFYEAWEVTGESKYLDLCSGICEFYCENLNVTKVDEGAICFSYTPVDKFLVHNINLLVAECLLRTGLSVKNEKFIQTGKLAAQYALKDQNEDGSLYYHGKAHNHRNPTRVDHYHSGFEMRSLYSIWKLTGDERYHTALNRYYQFYQKNLISRANGEVFPCMYPHTIYPINIHSCAEAILLNSVLIKEFPEAKETLFGVVGPILDRMQRHNGWFRYMIKKLGPFEVKSNIPFMRWGQAWMFVALSQALLSTKDE